MSILVAVRRLFPTRDDLGFTLVELSVAMTLTMILSVAALGAVWSFLSADNTVNQRLANTAQAQLFLDRITKEVRAAMATGSPSAAVQYADPNHITFTTGLNLFESGIGPRRVDIVLTAGVITETVTPAGPLTAAGWTWPGPASAIVTTSNIDASHGNLFSYYRAGADPTDPAATAMSTPITPTSLLPSSLIDSVRVDLWVRRSATSAPPLSAELTSSVHLRNVDYAQSPY